MENPFGFEVDDVALRDMHERFVRFQKSYFDVESRNTINY